MVGWYNGNIWRGTMLFFIFSELFYRVFCKTFFITMPVLLKLSVFPPTREISHFPPSALHTWEFCRNCTIKNSLTCIPFRTHHDLTLTHKTMEKLRETVFPFFLLAINFSPKPSLSYNPNTTLTILSTGRNSQWLTEHSTNKTCCGVRLAKEIEKLVSFPRTFSFELFRWTRNFFISRFSSFLSLV